MPRSDDRVLDLGSRMPAHSSEIAPAPVLPGGRLLVAVRRLVVTGLLAGAVYGLLATASRGICPGGVTSDGGYLDGDGAPTDVVPQCVNLTLHPSPLVFVALVAVLLWALTAVTRPVDEQTALRMLARARLVMIAVAIGSLVIAYLWFALIPLDEWNGTGSFLLPFPFGSVDVRITPLG